MKYQTNINNPIILGIGTDIVQKSRINVLWERFGNKFVQRILAPQEQAIFFKSNQKIAFLAKRFAAKEAVAKALGTGIGTALAFNEISVTNLPNGKPHVVLLGKAKNILDTKSLMISLSDEKDYALAFVIIT